jgi:single-stranded-DNA-specific exonuclease
MEEISEAGKKWITPQESPSKELEELCGNSLLAQILVNRGVFSIEEAKYYLPGSNRTYSSPYELNGMSEAVERVKRAVNESQKIVIYGDYDVDGTTSTALLVSFIKESGGDVSFYIPNRFTEGYGLNGRAVVQIKTKFKANLLITCDCGITNIEEVKLANSIGLDVIITDHHSLPDELPPATAVLNPKLLAEKHPLYWLPGVGVAYKLAKALAKEFDKEESVKQHLDLVALGMIADMAPLRSENRFFVLDGLKELSKTQKVGLRALLKECKFEISEESVGFALAPRINAAGRLNDAKEAVELFLATDENTAEGLAKHLSSQNAARQKLCDKIFLDITNNISEEELESGAIMLSSADWHQGVIGIVASRLVERFHLPVFLAIEEGESIKGSARGIASLDLFTTMNADAELFTKFGGHKAAAGFSMEKVNWDKFRQSFKKRLKGILTKDDYVPTLRIDAELESKELNLEILNIIQKLAPYGVGFERPIFTNGETALIKESKPFGAGQEHYRLQIQFGNNLVEAVKWRVREQESLRKFNPGTIKIAFTPNLKTFGGSNSLQLELRDYLMPKAPEISSPVSGFNIGELTVFDFREHSNQYEQPENNGFVYSIPSMVELPKEETHETLIFASLPSEKYLIEHLINKVGAKQIYLLAQGNTEKTTKDVLKNTLQAIRLLSRGKDGFISDLSDFLLLCGEGKETLNEALQLLKESGRIDFNFEGQCVNIKVFQQASKVSLDTSKLSRLIDEDKNNRAKINRLPINQLIKPI